jgi:DNA invertase Pin-like site-specific DNA recombinase
MASKKAYSYIRMSTDIQIKGDSLQRQMQLSESYATTHGLELITEYQDLGISAYKSDNLKSGSLGKFMDAVKDGRISKGSYLLVESLDRLSRAQPIRALSLFQEIVALDITIVTLADNQTYSAASITASPFQLMMSILVMIRAHEESVTKSQRISAAWESKRKNVHNLKLTKTAPHWLKLSDDRTKFDILSDRVLLVNKIFQFSVDGQGVEMIARHLNATEVPCWGRTQGWRASYIKKLLTNRSVLGELTTYKAEEGVRVPQELIRDYFPAVVSRDLYYAAEKARGLRKGKGGPKGVQVANLFSAVAKCGYCGGPARLKDRGKKTGKYITCDKAQRGMPCVSKGFPYEALESTFLEVVHEIALDKLLASEKTHNELSEINAQLEMLQADQLHIRKQLLNLLNIALASGGSSSKTLNDKMIELEFEETAVIDSIKALEDARSTLEMAPANAKHSLTETKSLIAQLQDVEGTERTELRIKIQQRIRSIIQKIDIFPLGQDPKLEDKISRTRKFLQEKNENPDDLEKHLSHLKKITTVTRQYMIHFHSGRYCVVNLSKSDPSKWDSKFDTDDLKLTPEDIVQMNPVDPMQEDEEFLLLLKEGGKYLQELDKNQT